MSEHTQPPETPDEVEDYREQLWLLGGLKLAVTQLQAENTELRERCTRTHVDPDSQHLLDIIDRLQARAERYEKALREVVGTPAEYEVGGSCGYCDSKDIALAALSDSTTGDHE